MNDCLVRVVSEDGLLRGALAVTTDLVTEICRLQQTDLRATVALGRLLSAGALLCSTLKGKQRLALMIEGNGPLQRLSVEADATGRLRGTVRHAQPGLPPKEGRFDVAGAIGRAGFLHVWKDLGLKEPYRSMVQLQTSEIGEDIAWYLATSEQVPSSLGLGVELDAAGQVAAAGGFLIQALPPGDAEQLAGLEERIAALPPVTTLLRQGLGGEEILRQIFGSIPLRPAESSSLTFHCPCSRPQTEAMLLGLGAEELNALLEERGEAEVTCEYCQQSYHFAGAELRQLLSCLAQH